MADNNPQGRGLFRHTRSRQVPRPAAWRVVWVQFVIGLVLFAGTALWRYELAVSVLAASLLSVLAQGYFTWRSLYHYGARHTGLFIVGTTQGLFGKWIIVVFGLVVLGVMFTGLNTTAMLLTVCVLNTLAVVLTPILIK